MTETEYRNWIDAQLPGCLTCPSFTYDGDCGNPYCPQRLTKLNIVGILRPLLTWTPGTTYNVGDRVDYDGVYYVCIVSHTSGATFSIAPNWAAFVTGSGIDVAKAWVALTLYGLGDVMMHDSEYYTCVVPHTSGAEFTDGCEWASIGGFW